MAMKGRQYCGSCGERSSGQFCGYCGSRIRQAEDVSIQARALNELHEALVNAERKEAARLLKNGTLPNDRELLVEAGLRTLPHINPDDVLMGVTEAAIKRLKTVMRKLRLRHQDEYTRNALRQFERELREYRARDRQNLISGTIALGVIASVIAGIVVLVVVLT